jgi:hypothetical protein
MDASVQVDLNAPPWHIDAVAGASTPSLPVSLSMTLPRLVRKASAPFAGKKILRMGQGFNRVFISGFRGGAGRL